MKKVNLQTIVQHGSNLIAQEIEGRISILDPKREEIYTLNETATFIWNIAKKPVAIREIIKRLENEFAVSSKRAEKDVLDFINHYLKLGLLASPKSPRRKAKKS